MLVHFDKTTCNRHKLPYEYICSNPNCKCTVRLCLKCAQEHQNKQDIQDDFIKESVYSRKLEIQTEIVAKQYSYLQNYKDSTTEAGLLNSKNEENIQVVQIILLALNEEKKNIMVNLEEFNFNHYEVQRRLNKVKHTSNMTYLTNLRNQQLVTLLINLSNESGLEKLRRKAISAHSASQKYHDFVTAVHKYGTTNKQFLTGLGFKEQSLFKTKLKTCMSRWRNNKNVQIVEEKVRPTSNTQRKKDSSQKRVRGMQYRNNSPNKKISLVSANRRPKTNSDKQN